MRYVWGERDLRGGWEAGTEAEQVKYVCEKCFTQVSFTINCHHYYFPKYDDGGKCWMMVVMVLMLSLVQLPWSYSIP